ncbi:hypothetical protein ACIA5D_36650 [Actinoplanes sp. NPDC051513]|uniref:hypothetical protein n=1 Tax=Actinoplanes sp. NPDC051513 TaxID=3363908 RepID=UPI0037B7A509
MNLTVEETQVLSWALLQQVSCAVGEEHRLARWYPDPNPGTEIHGMRPNALAFVDADVANRLIEASLLYLTDGRDTEGCRWLRPVDAEAIRSLIGGPQ